MLPSLATLAALLAGAAGPAPSTAKVHRYAAGAPGIFVNAYLVETAHGVVAIDATLTESDSKALRALQAGLGKPLRAVLLTHGHPDHYNGVTNLLADAPVPVVATAGVDRVIRGDDAAKEQQWKSTFGPEWPARRTFPTRIVRDRESLTFDGVTFTVHDLGPGESHRDSVWVMSGPEKAAFVGDVVLNRVHAFTRDGHTGAWLRNLDRVQALAKGLPVYPGHGEPGTAEMLDWQRDYQRRYRQEVGALAAGRESLTDAEKATLVARMKEQLATDRLEFLIGLGADAVALELSQEKKKAR
jgi:glyoxylase-like metal-dependent hydrolase (beta-lactamase superfamily II)